MLPVSSAPKPTSPGLRIGHVHLRVSDLDRSIARSSGVPGLVVLQRMPSGAAFLRAGGYHHHLGLNTWDSLGAAPPPAGHTGLYHSAFLYPTRADLADAYRRVLEAGLKLDGHADHGVSEALYLRDPDQNGVELYWDKPKDAWPVDDNGTLAMFNRPIDLQALLAEAPAAA